MWNDLSREQKPFRAKDSPVEAHAQHARASTKVDRTRHIMEAAIDVNKAYYQQRTFEFSRCKGMPTMHSSKCIHE